MTAPSPSHVYDWLRWRLFRNSLRLMLGGSVARVVSIVLCSLLVWGLIFAASYYGFSVLKTRFTIALDGPTLTFLLSLLFFALTVLLIFSTGIILYASLFASPESVFLLSTPTTDDRLFVYKFQGAVA